MLSRAWTCLAGGSQEVELGKLSYGSDYYSGKYNTGVKRKKADEAACTYTRTGGGKDRRTAGPPEERRPSPANKVTQTGALL